MNSAERDPERRLTICVPCFPDEEGIFGHFETGLATTPLLVDGGQTLTVRRLHELALGDVYEANRGGWGNYYQPGQVFRLKVIELTWETAVLQRTEEPKSFRSDGELQVKLVALDGTQIDALCLDLRWAEDAPPDAPPELLHVVRTPRMISGEVYEFRAHQMVCVHLFEREATFEPAG